MNQFRVHLRQSTKGQVIFMDNTFKLTEKLYRAVYPPEVADLYWKKDGSISSAAFADPKGLSVDRQGNRDEGDVIDHMRQQFNGHILSIYVKHCESIGAVVRYLPSKQNRYHSEIHGSQDTVLLSKAQRRYLASHARICD